MTRSGLSLKKLLNWLSYDILSKLTNKLKTSRLVESISGIRGIFGQDINEQLAQDYGWAYLKLFQNNKKFLVIAGDSRKSTALLKKTFVKVFFQGKVKKVIDLGIVPIQVCEYAVLKSKAQGGVYITASHNEPEYNGWKFLKEDGALLSAKQSERLIGLARDERMERLVKDLRIWMQYKEKASIDNYINFILQQLGRRCVSQIRKARFKILADPNGGAAIAVLLQLFKKLGVEAQIINNKLGQFNRLVEPNQESLAYLGAKLKSGSWDFACGFDCDADRVELVVPDDSQFAQNMRTSVVSGNYVLALACEAMLVNTKGQIVVTNDATSCLVRDIVKKYHAQIKESEVGEMSVVEKMEKYHSLIGGEGSNGGVIISPIKCRDGIMTVALILKMMAQRGESLTEILETYPRYYSERIALNCSLDQSIKIKNKIESYYQAKGYKIQKTGRLGGGLKIFFDHNSFLWLRRSKTEADVLRLIADGDDIGKVQGILEEGQKLFKKFAK